MHRKRITVLITATMIAFLCACSTPLTLRCQPGESLQYHDLLYFGTGRIGQQRVSDAEWANFIGQVLTAHFPKGLTVLTGTGQWQSRSGEIAREQSHVLSLVHAGDSASEASITAVINKYKTLFDQESVLRVRSHACVAFR